MAVDGMPFSRRRHGPSFPFTGPTSVACGSATACLQILYTCFCKAHAFQLLNKVYLLWKHFRGEES